MLERRNNQGYLYLLPWIIGFLIFQLYPIAMSLYYSFTDYSFGSQYDFVGLANYLQIFTKDREVKNSLAVTFKFVFMSVPMKLISALIIAMLLNQALKGIGLFRTIYYLPSILGGSVAIAILWRHLFDLNGVVNVFLNRLGIKSIGFLTDPKIALTTISMLSVWQFGSSMLFFLAALKQVPQSLYEAAKIDGAGPVRSFFKITIPMISPMTLFNIIMQMINAFKEFNAPFIITKGGPLNSTYLYGMMVYENAFQHSKMGYASAQSWVLFLIILAFTALTFKSSPYWTFYEDGGDF